MCPWVLSIICLTPFCCSFSFFPTYHFSPSATPQDAPECQIGQSDWLHVPPYMCVCYAWDAMIRVYVMCLAVAPYSLPSSHSFLLCVSVYVSLSQQQWHIEGTAFRLVNLMEPLTRGVAWINMARRISGQRRSARAHLHQLPSQQHSRADRDASAQCMSQCSVLMFNSTLFNLS